MKKASQIAKLRPRPVPSKKFGSSRRRRNGPVVANADLSDEEYRVGPGRPPKEHQFKPGQSGNPKGAKRKDRSLVPDIKALLEQSLGEKIKQGERDQLMTKGAAGIAKLVDDFAAGDHHARRDLVNLASKLDIDLTAGRAEEIQRAVRTTMSADDQAMVDDYVRRRLVELQHQDDVEAGGESASNDRVAEQTEKDHDPSTDAASRRQ